MDVRTSLRALLHKYFGYPEFRSLQEDIAAAVVEGKDVLALLPTGGGKSVCFQIPALFLQGVCIVISPLIALMKDQVAQLQKRGIVAVALYSGMSKTEIDYALDRCVYGNVQFLYVSPERIKTELFLERLKKMDVRLIAIDEAHCISQWGYDFRPPYLQIQDLRALLPTVPCIALTATATPEVRGDICARLGFRPGYQVFVKSFSRDNLSYSVVQTEDKEGFLVRMLHKVKGTAVVYVRNRKRTEYYAKFLKQRGISADFYHAGLETALRSKKQEDWIEDRTRVIVSTNAFGMGIDKPNVRLVVHMDVPDSPEAYYQEAGRAGRDGLKAFAVLLFQEEDILQHKTQLEKSFPTEETIRRTYQSIGNAYKIAVGAGAFESYDLDIEYIHKNYDIGSYEIYSSLKRLEEQGFILLNEAFYRKSTLRILFNREEFYDFMLKSTKDLETTMKGVLRAFGGDIFTHTSALSEKKLAEHLKIPEEKLFRHLKYLSDQKVMEYIPQSDKPQLTFLHPRFDAQTLPLDLTLMKVRKETAEKKLHAMTTYVYSLDSCRTQLLLAYFGEHYPKGCGVCDVCVRVRKSSEKPKKECGKLIEEILAKEPLSPTILLKNLQSDFTTTEIKTAVKQLLEAQKIVYTSNGMLKVKV